MQTRADYTIKIAVILVRPIIWRRVLVPANIKLLQLHAVIQIVTEAPDSLQHFFIDGQKNIYADPAWKDLPKIKPSRDVRLEQLLRRPGDQLAYYCGDDDDWEHTIELLNVTENIGRASRAACTAGNRHCLRRRKSRKGSFLLPAINRMLQRVRL
jgi:pRiA4b ORF-3-like protein